MIWRWKNPGGVICFTSELASSSLTIATRPTSPHPVALYIILELALVWSLIVVVGHVFFLGYNRMELGRDGQDYEEDNE